jgi:hypothetical protein
MFDAEAKAELNPQTRRERLSFALGSASIMRTRKEAAMSQAITRMQRIEKKFLLTRTETERLRKKLSQYVLPDAYPFSSIRNVYYDTSTFSLIRASIEKPAFKEKLRLRSYSTPSSTDDVFVELKRKCKGVVYKRRIEMPLGDAVRFLSHEYAPEKPDQVMREIEWLTSRYELEPRVCVNYERFAFKGIHQPDLRITFDSKLSWQTHDPSLACPDWGASALPDDLSIMEVKCAGAMPLWLARMLSLEEVFPTSFSKYGYIYKTRLAKEQSWNLRPSFQVHSPSKPSLQAPRRRLSSESA